MSLAPSASPMSTAPMQLRHSPNAPAPALEVPALGFGCMRFPGKGLGTIDLDASERLVLQALDAGVTYFDTAYLYPGNEEALGQIVERNGVRDRLSIATKLPHHSVKAAPDFDRYLDASLKRLRTNRADFYLLHNMTSTAQWERLCNLGLREWAARQKAAGRIGHLGFSFHGSQPEFLRLLDAYPWDFCQIQYNYADQNYQAGRAGLERATEKGIPVIIMEPLLGGKLAGDLPRAASDLFMAAEKTRREQAGLVPADVPESARTQVAVAWALRWLWDQPGVTMVLSGMNSPEQLAQNAATARDALPGSLSPEERAMFAEVERVFRASYKVPCTGCNYCMPCPKGINIPGVFSSYNASYQVDYKTGVMGYFMCAGALGESPHYASDCVTCGKCMRHCPQGIRIPDELKRARKRLEIPGAKTVMKVAARFRV